jgi:hypothetical protein
MAEAKQQQVLDLEQELKALREELAASKAQEPHQRPHTQPSASELQHQRPHTQPSNGENTSGAQQEALECQLAEKNLRITELETVVETMKEGMATWTAQRDELKVRYHRIETYIDIFRQTFFIGFLAKMHNYCLSY